MVDIEVGEQEQVAELLENKTADPPYADAYPQSWIDRLTAWVQRLHGPAWLYYLGVVLVLTLTRVIVGWSDGSYPVGTFFPLHALVASTSAYLVLVIHYLDDRAGAALSDFRPVLTLGPDETRDAGYERLHYQLTTMPARPILAFSLAGLIFGVVHQPLVIPEAQLQSLKLYNSPAAFAIDSGLSGLNWMILLVIVYHTVRQLRLVSRIYTQYTTINIFETGPLYALSRVTAITAVALLFIAYLYLTFWLNWHFQTAADATIYGSLILLVLTTFMWPLWGAHRLLQQAKTRRKGEVARQMEVVTDELHRRTNAGDYSDMGNMNDALDSMIKEHGVLGKVSTWPWDQETVRVVVTAILLPVGLWIITRVLERLGF